MKLQPDRILGQTVTGHGTGWIGLDGEQFHQSMLIAWSGLRETWQHSLENMHMSPHWAALIATKPEVLLLGCGVQRMSLPAYVLAPLMALHIGIEAMDTGSACRTYNILAAENRKVAAILLV